MTLMTDLEHKRRKRQVLEDLARAIREARLASGLSQEQVAFAAGIAVYTYGCLERGLASSGDGANPTLDTVVRVFGALGLALGTQPARHQSAD